MIPGDTDRPAAEGGGESRPLRLDETRVYLAEWLSRREDATGGFSEEQIRQIHKVAGGDLDRIERLAEQALSEPARETQGGPARPGRGIGVGLVALLVLAGGLAVLMSGPEERAARAPQETAPAPASPAPRPGPVLEGVQPGDRLMRENGDQYVLQLIAAREIQTLRNYVERAAIPPRTLTLLKSRRDGEDWYILVYGLYPDRETARRQALRLPRYARELDPWPRRLADLQAEVANGGE